MSISSIEPDAPKPTEGQVPENPTSAPTQGATLNVPVTADASQPTPSKSTSRVVAEPANTDSASTNNFLDLLLDKIEPMDQARPNFKMLIYSDPGVGKTDLLGQIPNNLIVDSENGFETILYSDRRADNVQRLPFKTFQGLEMAVEEFHKNPEPLRKFKNISIDTVSNLHKRALADVIKREHGKAPSLINEYVAETEHHTENNEHIRQLVQSLCDLDRNVFLTCHARNLEPKGKPSKTFPDFSEKLANTLSGMMDVVAYMYIADIEGEEHRVLKFHPSSRIVAKARGRGKNLPDNMVDPTWEKINDILKLDV